MSEYLEYRKFKLVEPEIQSIHAFMEYLLGKGHFLAKYKANSSEINPVGTPFADIVAEYLEIDQVRLHNEKRAMIEELRRSTALRPD
jgi:hypothetical protein